MMDNPMWPLWCKDAISTISNKMDALHARYQQSDAQVVGLRDEAKALLKEAGLLTREVLNSKHIGVHPSNRYGDGLLPADVLALISNIYTQGFSMRALLDPSCTEMPPIGHPRRGHAELFNDQLVRGSGGQLPLFAETPRHMTVTCGHTSMGFRCFDAGVVHSDPRITKGGKLCLPLLQEVQPAYYEAVVHGISWDVVRWPAEDRWPWISSLLQESGNAGQQIARCESRIEVMLKINDIAARKMRLHNDPMWDQVAIEAVRGGSPFKDEICGLVEFVKNLGGGLDEPIFLFELRDFARQLKSVRTHRYSYYGHYDDDKDDEDEERESERE